MRRTTWAIAAILLATGTTCAAPNPSAPPMPKYDVSERCAGETDRNSCVLVQYRSRQKVAEVWLAIAPEARTECIAVSRWQDYITLYQCLAAHKLDAQVENGAAAAPTNPALANTLDKLRSLQKRTEPPKANFNLQASGSPTGSSGHLNSDDAGALSPTQRGAISDYVRRCWSTDPSILALDKMEVLLNITTDADGVVRRVVIAPEEEARVSADPSLRKFSERAIRAALDPACAILPLPQPMLGKTNVLSFRFRP